MRLNIFDAQQARTFLLQQASVIERQVYQIKHPDVQYSFLVPVDTSAPEWAKSITFFSSEKVGAAGWFHAESNDMPRADVAMSKYETAIEMAGIGYGYSLEELGQAQLIPGTNLPVDRAAAAKRAYELFLDNLTLRGDAGKDMDGLIDYTGVTAVTAAATGDVNATNAMDWENKTADQILVDVNTLITGMYTASLTVEISDTLLLPVASYTLIATKRLDDTVMTVLAFLQAHNVYTAITGQPLTIRAVRGLETAGASSTGRMVAYRRSPEVLKLHLPMPHRFLPVWQTGPLRFDVPGIFRTGGLEIRLPGAVRYMDGIITPGTN